MASKRKPSTPTKKDLEAKIANLESKISKLSTKIDTPPTPRPADTKPAQTQQRPADTSKPKGTLPKGTGQQAPKPAEVQTSKPKGVLPKGMEQKQAPKPASVGSATSNAEALETVYNNFPMTNTHEYKSKTPGYTPNPNRYHARNVAPRGKAPTQDWNLQKAKVSGYTAPSNQYFATRQRLAYHPPDKRFDGYDFKLEGVAVETKTQQAPPPPQKPKGTLPKGTLPKGMAPKEPQVQQSGKSKGQELEEYEKEYLVRIEREKQEHAKLMKAAEQLAAKTTQTTSTSRGTLPKGF